MKTSTRSMGKMALAVSLALLGACDTELAEDAPVTAADPQAIVSGLVDHGFPAVGTLTHTSVGDCTGTLVSTSMVLTARVCAGSGLEFQLPGHAPMPVDRQIYHAAGGLMLLHLATPVRDVVPLDINTYLLPAVGTTCLVVGRAVHSFPPPDFDTQRTRSAVVRVDSYDAGSTRLTASGLTGFSEEGDQGGPLVCGGHIAAVTLRRSGGPWQPTDDFAVVDGSWVTNTSSDSSGERAVAAVSWAHDRLDHFVRGTDGAIYHQAWDGHQLLPSPTSFDYLGGQTTGTPEAVSWGPGRLDVFARGKDLHVLHKAWDFDRWLPSTTEWEDLGGMIATHPTAVSWGAGRLDLFVVGLDGALYHKWWDGHAWEPSVLGWEYLGGTFKGPVSAVSWDVGRIDIFGLGMDGAMYHKVADENGWSPSQTGWEYLGGSFIGSPSAVSWAPGRLDIFGVGTDRKLWHKWVSGGWGPSLTGWQDLGGSYIGSPSATSWAPGRLDVVVEGTDAAVWHRSWNGLTWGGGSLSGVFAGSPSIVSWGEGRLDIYGPGQFFGLFHKFYQGDWGPAGNSWDYFGGVLGL
jgi:hypothetical protein